MKMIRLPWPRRPAKPAGPDPRLSVARKNGNKAAIVFIHGFTGTVAATWESFINIVLGDQDLTDWDVYSIGFPTSMSLDVPVWKTDPDITLCARSLATKLESEALNGYECLALVAHSMGGLVAQRAVLDDQALADRLCHLILYGTPSAGLHKAGWARLLKYQLRDMAHNSPFIVGLRREWKDVVGENPQFLFKAIAGEIDGFVPASSSIFPFPIAQQAAVPGNHLEIVRPDSKENLSYDIFKRLLAGNPGPISVTQTARLAVERKEFKKAIALLAPHADGLDQDAIVTFALALESDGQGARAIAVLEKWNGVHDGLDPRGALAGRLKRRWLVERQQVDFEQSLALYTAGRDEAIASGDDAQAYYHAINVAFLLLAKSPVDGSVPPVAIEAALLAEKHALLAPVSAWQMATLGEAKLIQGQLDPAIEQYRKAQKSAGTVRAYQSMYVQARAVASRVLNEAGRRQIDDAFDVKSPD